MDETQVKMKLLVDAITKEKLDGVVGQLEEIIGGQTTERKNKLIFKVLLYLSHAANKCDKSKRETGFEIWRIGCCICTNMTEIPDGKKFFSSVYHITSCLLDMGLYREALEICDYILPGNLWKKESSDCADMYSKVSHLLHNAALMLIKQTKLTSRKHYEVVVMIIKYELDITKLTHHSCWRYVLSRMLSYCEKIGAIKDSLAESSKEEFISAMLTYISQEKISLNDENKEHTYRLILLVITEMMVRNIDKTRIASIGQTLTRYFHPFRSCLQNYQSYLRCFKLYERLAMALVRPIKNVSSHELEEITWCTAELRKLLICYGYGDAIKWYSYSASILLSELLSYWEDIAKSNVAQYLTPTLIESTMSLLAEQCSIFNCYKVTNCRCGDSTKCSNENDVYNNVALRLKALSVVSRVLSNNACVVTEEMCNMAVEFIEESDAGITAIKDAGCNQWSLLWPVCGAHVYNIGISCESKYYEKSLHLYMLLLTSFIKHEKPKPTGNAPTLLNLRDPLSTLLHRLTSVNTSNGHYEEATIVCSLNGLLSSKITNTSKQTNECKAYISWANIKHKHPPARQLTMLQCLRSKKREISEIIKFRLEDYDPIVVCLREIKALADARVNLSSSIIEVLDEMERLNAPAASYVQGVHLLGYHLLNFQSQPSIAKYLRRASIHYERERLPSTSFRCSYGHIRFYQFSLRLDEIAKKTENAMKSAKFALTSSAISANHGEPASALPSSDNVVPTYSTINITVTREIASCLEQVLHIWKDAINANNNYKDSLQRWEILQILDIATLAAEYARLYHLESLEIEAWKLAYKLARDAEEHRAIIYITSRSLSSQRIDRKWIEKANQSLKIIEKSDASEVKETIVMYRLSLADFYYRTEEPELAQQFFLLATAKSDENFMSEMANSLLTAQLKMNQCPLDPNTDNQSNYTRIIVQSLYSMLSMEDATDMSTLGDKRKQLYNYDLIFEATNNLALRINSLLSYREGSAHLVRRLGTAQKLAAALRVAECLKCLCYIDLSRAKLDDCEVKLQGLEHILEIEGFDLTMKSTPAPNPIPSGPIFSRVVEAVRDIGQSDTSPVLRQKVFATPDFTLHGELCTCFKCANSRYQNLVFASTHLRAQLFSLRRNSEAALQHFEGALVIKQNILSRAEANAQRRFDNNNDSTILRSPFRHLDVVEYVIFHLDYCRFLKWSMPQRISDGIEIALGALELCEKYNLTNHPVYVSTNLLIFEYRFEDAYSDAHFSKFTVPAVDEMDIGRYMVHEPTDDRIVCVTPSREIVPQKAISVRRRKTPPFLKLEKVPIDLTEEEPPISTSPPARTGRINRRNIIDGQQDFNNLELASERKKSIVPRINLSPSSSDDDHRESVVPKRSSDIGRKSGNIGDVETKSSTRSRSKKISASTRSSSSSTATTTTTSIIGEASTIPAIKIDEVTDLLGELTVRKTRSSGRSSNDTRNAGNSGKTVETVITVPSDCASSSEDEIAVEGKRGSLRLRKKRQDSLSIGTRSNFQSSNQSPTKSEDEVVIIETRSRRRAVSSTEQATAPREPVKSSRTRVISKRST